MHDELLPSVRTKYIPGDNIISRIQQVAQKLKQDPNIIKIYLFGSFVRKDHVPGSDADICIVLKTDNRRVIDRIPGFLEFFKDVGVPVDVFPYTLEEFEKMIRIENPFVREILATGKEL
jgi:predicted nucleotidyltransferase